MTDSITVISQTTAERKQETIELFNKIKPILDKGGIYSRACKEVLGLTYAPSCINGLTWFRDVVAYGESQGYRFKDYSGKRKMKS